MTLEFISLNSIYVRRIIHKVGVRKLSAFVSHGDVVATNHNAITLLIDIFAASGRTACFFVAIRNTLLPKLIFGKIRFQVSVEFVEARS